VLDFYTNFSIEYGHQKRYNLQNNFYTSLLTGGIMILGEKLKIIRTARALSLDDLAKKTNLTRSFLYQIEKK
jgi:DNA-binding XRE family transcriptional regulator